MVYRTLNFVKGDNLCDVLFACLLKTDWQCDYLHGKGELVALFLVVCYIYRPTLRLICLFDLFVALFKDTSTLVGHLVSSPREREKKNRMATVCGQWSPGSDWRDAQADLGLRCSHMPEHMFSHGETPVGWLIWLLTTQSTLLRSCRECQFT